MALEVSRQGMRAHAAVIGDLIGSRRASQPSVVHDRLREALARVNDRLGDVQPLQPTIGDEFQGVYRRIGDAVNATLLVRLLLRGVTGVRFGVGWGTFTRWDPERAPFEQDGPAWWAAREALDAVREQERRVGTPEGWVTAVRLGAAPESESSGGEIPVGGAPPAMLDRDESPADAVPASPSAGRLLDGIVMFRDHVVAMLDDRDVGLVLALLGGASVTDAAAQAGISQQAASRRLRSKGGYSVLRSWELLESFS